MLVFHVCLFVYVCMYYECVCMYYEGIYVFVLLVSCMYMIHTALFVEGVACIYVFMYMFVYLKKIGLSPCGLIHVCTDVFFESISVG
jgi:hypothetical protein